MPTKFAEPQYLNSQVNLAGKVLADPTSDEAAKVEASKVLNNWRACHAYPINTFQATLRDKLKALSAKADVAQRLKRAPSIVKKLQKLKTMKLVQMQDIGGVRAVVADMATLRNLEASYAESSLLHELVNKKDYVASPKKSGYRSIHLVYRYRKPSHPIYDGFLIEVQLRTKTQHAWATAVETVDTFLGLALKSSEGPEEWLKFFSLAGSAVSLYEGGPAVPGYEGLTELETYTRTIAEARRLGIGTKLRAFTAAVKSMPKLKTSGGYFLLRLNAVKRVISWKVFRRRDLNEATRAYQSAEASAAQEPGVQVVLVSAQSVASLKRAYPNYFLDTHEVLNLLNAMAVVAEGPDSFGTI